MAIEIMKQEWRMDEIVEGAKRIPPSIVILDKDDNIACRIAMTPNKDVAVYLQDGYKWAGVTGRAKGEE